MSGGRVGATGGTGVAVAPVHLAPMRRRHLRSVLRIEGQSDHEGWSLGLFMSELTRPEGRVYLVAKVGHRVVGFAGLLLVAGEGHVTTIATDADRRRQGIGTRLLLELVRRAIAAGAEALTLEVRTTNEAAIGLYRAFGFSPAGIRAGYYRDTGEDALIMWASDVAAPGYAARLDAIEARLPEPSIVEGP